MQCDVRLETHFSRPASLLGAIRAFDMVWVVDHTMEDMTLVVEGDFEWDSAKAESNRVRRSVCGLPRRWFWNGHVGDHRDLPS